MTGLEGEHIFVDGAAVADGEPAHVPGDEWLIDLAPEARLRDDCP